MASIVVLLCVSWLGLAAAGTAPPYDLADAEHHFETFVQKHGKVYTNEKEKQYRLEVFKNNLLHYNKLNAESDHAVFGITRFSDLTSFDFHARHGCYNPNLKDGHQCDMITDDDIKYNDAPESFDWRDKSVVTPVKDQGSDCGSCYAFSALANVESLYGIKHKDTLDLSVQQVVDCSTENHGCHGGIMSKVFRYLLDNGGSESSADYPYEGKQGDCRFDQQKVKIKLSNCHTYSLQSQEKVKQLLYHNGPIVIGIKGEGVMGYTGGIISDKHCDVGELNHGVLLVGYGSENGSDYWIVKNSWGTGYGEKGYFRMQRREGGFACGMMNEAMTSSVVA